MVERILEQERALRQVLGADWKSSHLIPTWQDIDVLEAVNKALHEVPHPSEEEPPPQRKRRLGEILQKDKSAQPTEDKTLRVSKEVERYLQAPQQDSTEDPLVWWKDNAASYPALSKLSKKYLCISATSSSSERMFSTAGNVVTKKRSLLKPEKVDMLVFLAKNL